jgi:hypothetical protein
LSTPGDRRGGVSIVGDPRERMGGVNVLNFGVSSSSSSEDNEGEENEGEDNEGEDNEGEDTAAGFFPKVPVRGEYTLDPQAGSSSGLGETLIAPRSYEFGECVENVAVNPGEGGKWT